MGVRDKRGDNRVNRGGSWDNDAANCRSGNRNNNSPDNRNHWLGFRLVSSSPQQPEEQCLRTLLQCTGADHCPYPVPGLVHGQTGAKPLRLVGPALRDSTVAAVFTHHLI
jgi:hypothetical protein